MPSPISASPRRPSRQPAPTANHNEGPLVQVPSRHTLDGEPPSCMKFSRISDGETALRCEGPARCRAPGRLTWSRWSGRAGHACAPSSAATWRRSRWRCRRARARLGRRERASSAAARRRSRQRRRSRRPAALVLGDRSDRASELELCRRWRSRGVLAERERRTRASVGSWRFAFGCGRKAAKVGSTPTKSAIDR